jgi:Sulfotransferase domain
MTPAFVESYEKYIKNFEIYKDDVIISGFQRSGTTMLQELVWLILNDFRFESTEKSDIYNRAQMIE